jgi:hypothetical protein
MYGSKRQGAAGVLPESTQSSGTEAAILTLSRVQRFAAEQRAIAEDTLAKARDFEEQIANERAALAECVAAAEAAEAGEREAEAHLSAAREQLAAASNAQARAQAEVDARRQLVAERHEARVACDADSRWASNHSFLWAGSRITGVHDIGNRRSIYRRPTPERLHTCDIDYERPPDVPFTLCASRLSNPCSEISSEVWGFDNF